METQRISCLYYPTTVVLVDDDKKLLEKTQFQLGTSAICKTFSDPEEALNFIVNESEEKTNPLKNIVEIDEDSMNYSHTSGYLPLQFAVSKIYEHIYDPSQYEEISIVVVDFAMPKMNGEEFAQKLRKIKGNKVKIIMLTGEADEQTAIRLFNSGVIDRFLRKGKAGLSEELPHCISEMQKNYFSDLSFPILEGLGSDKDSCLGDPAFKDFFNDLCKTISPSSYFLTEVSGSFLFIDNAGSPTWLLIKTLEELKEIATQMDDQDLPEHLVDAVEQGDLIPYFGNEEIDFFSEAPEASEINKYLFKAEKLNGQKEYRYALVKEELPGFSLDKSRILSFNDYISHL